MAAKQTKKITIFFLCVLFESTVFSPKYSLPPRFYAFYADLRFFCFQFFLFFVVLFGLFFVFVVPDSCR